MSFPAPFFESFFQEAKQLFFVYHLPSQQVTYVNQAYEKVLQGHAGQVNEELPGLLTRVHPDDRDHAADCWERWTRGRLRDAFELRLQQADGEEQWFCVTPHYFTDPAGAVWLGGLAEDITVSKVMLMHADKFNTKKNATLEILSHDLAGPFALMQQMSGYFRDVTAPLQDARLDRMIDEMHDTCRDSINLIRDFVSQEFMASVNVVLKRERVNLVEKLRLLMEEFQHSERHLEKHFVFRVDANPVYVDMDQNKFQQVINNLISNAMKFTPDGGTITLAVGKEPGYALVSLADTGIGIPKALQAGLFEKFTKARRPGLRGEKSTGLGMSIIKTIVELHEGVIWLDSAENEGTTFYIKLPVPDAGDD